MVVADIAAGVDVGVGLIAVRLRKQRSGCDHPLHDENWNQKTIGWWLINYFVCSWRVIWEESRLGNFWTPQKVIVGILHSGEGGRFPWLFCFKVCRAPCVRASTLVTRVQTPVRLFYAIFGWFWFRVEAKRCPFCQAQSECAQNGAEWRKCAQTRAGLGLKVCGCDRKLAAGVEIPGSRTNSTQSGSNNSRLVFDRAVVDRRASALRHKKRHPEKRWQIRFFWQIRTRGLVPRN